MATLLHGGTVHQLKIKIMIIIKITTVISRDQTKTGNFAETRQLNYIQQVNNTDMDFYNTCCTKVIDKFT